MQSSLYDCNVAHERLSPHRHKFKYGIYMLYIDLSELNELDSRFKIFGVDRPNLISFYQSDHLKAENKEENSASLSLFERLKYLARHEGIVANVASAALLTMPRIFGYIFNPVSFYFLFDENKSCHSCVVEVSNTFHEMKTYVIKDIDNHSACFRLTVPKYFYVSPFGKLADKFDFTIAPPDQKLRICINTVSAENNAKVLLSNLNGERQLLTEKSLIASFCRYPFLTLKVIGLIHYQAVVLFFKQVPFFAKEMDPHLQVAVHNKHISLKKSDTKENTYARAKSSTKN